MILVLGKARSCKVLNLGCSGAESPGSFNVLPKNCRCDAWAGALSWWSCQSPFSHSFSLLNHPNSFWEGMFKLNAKFDLQIHCSTYSVILNVTATQYTCSLNIIYCPHWLVQWSCHCSHMHIPSTLLGCQVTYCHTNHSCYINNGSTFSGQTLYI